jgi:metal-sulfur cluster biosynthetic enzyme
VTEVSERAVRAALNQVIDPCSCAAGAPAGLDDMGLVRSVEISPCPGGARVSVTLRLTEPTCLMGAPFVRATEERLAQLKGISEFEVALTSGIDWTEDDLRPAYAVRLAAARDMRTRAG